MTKVDYLKHGFKLFFKRKAFPEQVTFFVTSKCNARCKHCFAWRTLNDNDQDNLTLGEIEKITKSMGNFTYLLIGGGEPFLRKDLAEIVKIFYRNNNVLNTAISTNGSLPQVTIDVVEEILKDFKNCLTVNVSFDEIGQRHDDIRQLPGIFAHATKTHEMLKGLKARYANLNVGIILTCTPFNCKNLPEIYTWLKQNLKPYSIVLNYMRGEVRDKSKLPDIDLSVYEKVARMIEKDIVSGEVPGHSNFPFSEFNLASKILMRQIVSNTVRKNCFQLPCFAGTLNCVLGHNGDVYPCEMLDRKMGNLRENDYNFNKVWASKTAKEIRFFIKQSRCFCTEECNINMNILFNLRCLPRILVNVIKIRIFRLLRHKRNG